MICYKRCYHSLKIKWILLILKLAKIFLKMNKNKLKKLKKRLKMFLKFYRLRKKMYLKTNKIHKKKNLLKMKNNTTKTNLEICLNNLTKYWIKKKIKLHSRRTQRILLQSSFKDYLAMIQINQQIVKMLKWWICLKVY